MFIGHQSQAEILILAPGTRTGSPIPLNVHFERPRSPAKK